MKTKDLLVLGAIGLGAFLLMPKGEEGEPKSSIITIPSAQTPFDIGGIFGGMADMFSGIFKAMPTQIIPEINIPEFKFPDIDMPEFPDWDKFFVDLPDELKIPDVPSLIPDIPGIFKFPDITPDVSQWDIWKKDTAQTISDVGEFFRKMTTIPSRFVPTEYYEQSEQKWIEKDYPENITPAWYYAREEATRGLLPEQYLAYKEAVSGRTSESPALPYPEYEADIELLKKHPYFSTVI